MRQFIHVILYFLLIIPVSCKEKTTSPANGIIAAGNYEIYYERAGKGDAILLLHAGLQDQTMWAEQVKELSTDYEVITIDRPHHGKTTGTDTTILAQEIIRIFLDSLQLKKVSVAGLSMGASVAQDFVIAYPARVNKAIFIAAGVNGLDKMVTVDSASMAWYVQFQQALDQKDTAAAAKAFTQAWAEGIFRKGDSLRSASSKYVYNKTLETLKKHRMGGWPRLKNDPPAVESISTIKVPVQIIDGDKDLPYITISSAYLAQHIPGAKRIVIKDVAHMLNMEKPKELNSLIKDFLGNK